MKSNNLICFINSNLYKMIKRIFKPLILDVINNEIRIWGPTERLRISPKAQMVNALFNTNSGNITVGDYTFAGHNVSIITGSHNIEQFGEDRIKFKTAGRDVTIGKGVWIGSNAIILGPCSVGDHAIISAGAVVITDVPPLTMVGGVPAIEIKRLNHQV